MDQMKSIAIGSRAVKESGGTTVYSSGKSGGTSFLAFEVMQMQ
jgi:hypothetical protein